MSTKFARYNAQVSGNLTSDFGRAVATRDLRGVDCAANERRYGKALAVAPEVNWSGSGVTVGAGGNPYIYASGYDSDGETPLIIINDSNSENIRIYRGQSPSLVRSLSYTGDDILGGAVSGNDYEPRAAMIYHGYIAFLCTRRESGNVVGISLIGMTSYDATLSADSRLDVATLSGGGKDIDPLAGSVLPTNATLGRHWCFQNPFPTNYSNTLGAWIGGTDYISAGDSPQGGQAFAFRITRPDTNTAFTAEPVRVLYDNWDASATQRHLHGLAFCIDDDCIDIHAGDSSGQNEIIRVSIDLENYDTDASMSTSTIHGGRDNADNIQLDSPQAVSLCPGTSAGTYLGASDVSREKLHRFNVTGSGVEVKDVLSGLNRSRDNWDFLNLHYLPGTGWVYGSGKMSRDYHCCYVSSDGTNFAEINPPASIATTFGNVWVYGSKLACLSTSREILLADFPSVSVINPLMVSPGGDNLVIDVFETDQNPTSTGNTVENGIYYDGTNFRDSGDAILDPEPPAPPFVDATPIARFTSDGTPNGGNFGRRWLTDASDLLDVSVNNICVVWICNLSDDQGIDIEHRFGRGGAGGAISSVFDNSHPYLEWMPLVLYGEPTSDTPDQGRYWTFSPTSAAGKNSPNVDFLIAIDHVGPSDATPYSTDAESTSNPDELAKESGFVCESSWTIAVIFQWPWNASIDLAAATFTLFTYYEDANNYVEIRYQQVSDTAGNIIADFVVSGSSVGTVTVAVDIQPSQVVDVVLTNTGTVQNVTGRNSANASVSQAGALTAGIDPVEVRWSNADQSAVHSINPILAYVDTENAWDSAQIDNWLASSLSERISSGAGLRANQLLLPSA